MNTQLARTSLARIALIAAAALSSSAAQATLVVNGDFEAGDFSGWTQTGDTAFTGVDGFAPHSGNFGAFFGSIGGTTLSQTLATNPGATYLVEFWLQLAQDDLPTSFSWSLGGSTQATLTDSPSFTYTAFSTVFNATSTSTVLAFNFMNEPGFFDFDDVSVTQLVPEPGSIVLALAGLGLLNGVSRRRASVSVAEQGR